MTKRNGYSFESSFYSFLLKHFPKRNVIKKGKGVDFIVNTSKFIWFFELKNKKTITKRERRRFILKLNKRVNEIIQKGFCVSGKKKRKIRFKAKEIRKFIISKSNNFYDEKAYTKYGKVELMNYEDFKKILRC